jgi:hypothetical protein
MKRFDIPNFNVNNSDQVQWFMTVVPATQEVEIGGSQFKTSLGKKLGRPLSLSINCLCSQLYVGGFCLFSSRQKCKTLSEKITKNANKITL